MNEKHNVMSKYISLILRHKPETVGVEVDKNGWCNIERLIEGINKSGRSITREMLESIVTSDEKQRYTIDYELNMIRANQGHSIIVDVGLDLKTPPERLYHCTVDKFISSIKTQGLIKGQRQYVHLSQDKKTAISVGKRRGKPIVLEIDSLRMYKDGYKFYVSTNNVWLCENVPVAYIHFDEKYYGI